MHRSKTAISTTGSKANANNIAAGAAGLSKSSVPVLKKEAPEEDLTQENSHSFSTKSDLAGLAAASENPADSGLDAFKAGERPLPKIKIKPALQLKSGTYLDSPVIQMKKPVFKDGKWRVEGINEGFTSKEKAERAYEKMKAEMASASSEKPKAEKSKTKTKVKAEQDDADDKEREAGESKRVLTADEIEAREKDPILVARGKATAAKHTAKANDLTARLNTEMSEQKLSGTVEKMGGATSTKIFGMKDGEKRVKEPASYAGDREAQMRRWIAMSLYAYLKLMEKASMEVQVGMKGKVIGISANEEDKIKILATALDNGIASIKTIAAKVIENIGTGKLQLERDEAIRTLRHCAKLLRNKYNILNKYKSVEVTAGGGSKLPAGYHAELRLVEAGFEDINGVKRPCVACFISLKKKGFKPKSCGPFWPSMPSMNAIYKLLGIAKNTEYTKLAPKDLEKIIALLAPAMEHSYVTKSQVDRQPTTKYDTDSDSDVDEKSKGGDKDPELAAIPKAAILIRHFKEGKKIAPGAKEEALPAASSGKTHAKKTGARPAIAGLDGDAWGDEKEKTAPKGAGLFPAIPGASPATVDKSRGTKAKPKLDPGTSPGGAHSEEEKKLMRATKAGALVYDPSFRAAGAGVARARPASVNGFGKTYPTVPHKDGDACFWGMLRGKGFTPTDLSAAAKKAGVTVDMHLTEDKAVEIVKVLNETKSTTFTLQIDVFNIISCAPVRKRLHQDKGTIMRIGLFSGAGTGYYVLPE
jgi:hypothetical protein